MIYLPLEYSQIRTQLEQYLVRNPQNAHFFAIKYFRDFVALSIKYQELQTQPTKSYSNSIPDLSFELPLEQDFELATLRYHLNKYPKQAHELAIGHLEDYLNLTTWYKNLLSQINKEPSLSLPDFLNNNQV